MIGQELARELKVAQLPWRPRRGDLVMDRLNVPFIVLRDGPDDDGAVEIDTGAGVERRPFLGLTWVPRLDQLLVFIARAGHATLTASGPIEGRSGPTWTLTLRLPEHGDDRHFTASDPAHAAGLALHCLLADFGWSAGRAL